MAAKPRRGNSAPIPRFQETTSMVMQQTKTFRRTLSASSLSKDKVYNTRGEHLGDVRDIMIDISSGRIAYVACWAWAANSSPFPGTP
jgi:hypothetical protein